MKYMRRRGLRMFAVAALLPMMALAQTQKPAAVQEPDTQQQLIQMVRSYMANVQLNGSMVVQDFFADDAIFTGATGLRRTKLELVQFMSVKPGPDSRTTYETSDFTTHVYEEGLAVVNFGVRSRKFKNSKSGETIIAEYFRGTSTFLKRDDKWQIVAWQFTPVKDPTDKK
jgi:hypothetical protein